MRKKNKAILCIIFLIINLLNNNSYALICPSAISIGPTATQTLCLNAIANQLTATLTTSGSTTNTNITYTWYSNLTNTIVISGSTITEQTLNTNTSTITNNFTPLTTTVGTRFYFCQVTSGGACGGGPWTTATVQVTVNPLPNPIISPTAATCLNSTVTYSTTNVAGHTYSWSVAGGTVNGSSTGSSVSITWNSTTGTSVTVTETITSTGCFKTVTQNITVNPLPNPIISPTAATCLNSTVTYSTTNVAGHTYSWSVAGGTINGSSTGSSVLITWNSTTGTSVTVTETITSTGCFKTVTQNITVNPLPNPIISPTAATCLNSTVTYSTTNVAGHTYSWSVAGGTINGSSTGSSVSITWNSTTGTSVTVTETITSTGCFKTVTQNITVNPLPNPIISPTAATCLNSTVTYSTTNVAGHTYSWSVAGGTINGSSTGSSVSITWNSTTGTSVTVTETITSTGCFKTVTQNITVNPLPNPIISPTAATCLNSTVTYSTTNVAGHTYSWSVAGGTINGSSTGSSVSITWNSTTGTSVTVTETITSTGCFKTVTQNITVNPLPNPIISPTAATCLNSTVTYSTTNVAGHTYSWSVAGGTINGSSTGSPVSITWNSTTGTSVTVTETITSTGCFKTVTQNVTVNPLPTITISENDQSGGIADDSIICTGDPATIIATTGYSIYSWVPILSPPGPGPYVLNINNTNTYTVTVTDANNCTNTASITIKVVPPPPPISQSNIIVCDDSVISGTTWTGSQSYFWENTGDNIGLPSGFGFGNIPQLQAQNNGSDPDTAKIKVTPFNFNNGDTCWGSFINFTIIVNPAPQLSSSSVDTLCDDSLFSYSAISATAGTSFSWTRAVVPGIGNSAGSGNNGIVNEILNNTTDHQVDVIYVFTLTANGCPHTQSVVVTVNPTPLLSPPLTAVLCDDSLFSYSATSATAGTSFSWTRAVVPGIGNPAGSGNNGIVNEILNNTTDHQVDIIYVFTLTANGCPHIQSVVVTVNPTPLLSPPLTAVLCDDSLFSYSATSATAGTSFSWTRAVVPGIGNPAGSGNNGIVNEILNNTTADTIQVTYVFDLTANGCPHTQNVVVTVNPTPLLSTPLTAMLCDDSLFSYTATSATVGTAFSWTRAVVSGIGNPAGSGNNGIVNEVLNNTTADTIQVTYVFDLTANGCPHSQNVVVTVNPTPLLSTPLTAMLCDDSLFSYTAASVTVGTAFSWTRAVVSGISNPAGSGNNGIVNEVLNNTTDHPIDVMYIFTLTSNGCPHSENVAATIVPTPALNPPFSYTICSGVPLNDTLRGTFANNNVTYSWTSNPSTTNITGNTNVPFPGTIDSIIPDILINHTTNTTFTLPYIVTLTYTNGISCSSSAALNVTINPAPEIPHVNSTTFGSTIATSLCAGSTNINYNVTNIFGNDIYTWSVQSSNGGIAEIKDDDNANTVISFNTVGTYVVTIIAQDDSFPTKCPSDTSFNVDVTTSTIKNDKIIFKEPGAFLVYPDNSMDSYQWGYDTILNYTNGTGQPPEHAGPPHTIPGQTFQAFVPDTVFKYENLTTTDNDDALKEDKYYFWVLVSKNGCQSKVYYNGPYKDKTIVQDDPVFSSIGVNLSPNPSRGSFDFSLYGKIYGKIQLNIFDRMGNIAHQGSFLKKQSVISEHLDLSQLANGLYFMRFQSPDGKEVITKIIINH